MSDVGFRRSWRCASRSVFNRNPASEIPLHRSSPTRCSFIKLVVPGRPIGWPATNTTLSPFLSNPRSHSSASESVSISSVEGYVRSRDGEPSRDDPEVGEYQDSNGRSWQTYGPSAWR